ncbi:winged helix-turn-helix domain-containing protein [Dankookia sp. GCM10030260]|uniref:winged helix-turn-helix domain-containing protein n=1 Tax=Dankookia sp. GCM10030260 TaxID=3273390 RepID=UPI00361E95FF
MSKPMRSLDLSWQTPRPRQAKSDHAAQERFKKGASRKPSRRSRPTTPRPSGSRFGSKMVGRIRPTA